MTKHPHTCGEYGVLDLCVAAQMDARGKIRLGPTESVVDGTAVTNDDPSDDDSEDALWTPERHRDILVHIGLLTDVTRGWVDKTFSPGRTMKIMVHLETMKDHGAAARGCHVCRQWYNNALTAAAGRLPVHGADDANNLANELLNNLGE